MRLYVPSKSVRKRRRLSSRNGAVVPLLALMLPVVVILAAFAINIAYLELNRTEMHIASDAASRAAGREFMITNDQALSRAKGRDAGSRNSIGGKPLQLADTDFVFGQSSRSSASSRYTFIAGGGRPNAVEVTARRTTGSVNGPLEMLLPNPFTTTKVESFQTARSNQIEVDVALVIDRSGSMAYADNEPAVFPPLPAAAPPGWLFDGPVPNPSRWRDAVAAVDVFLTELSSSPINEMVSLSTYNDGTRVDEQLTTNYANIRSDLDGYTNFFESGATNIGGGINAGVSTFEGPNARPFAAKVIIVLTDGIDTVGSDPIGIAEDAAEQQIMVFSITFANEADQATMAQVAVKGHGKHYHAATGTNLTQVFRDIARQLPVLLSK
jgi:Ca-activated chloride channel family protein